MSKILFISFVSLFSVCLNAQQNGTFTDSRDGMTYKTIKIGNQTWMAENLRYRPVNGNYWFYNNDYGFEIKCDYILYDWETAKNVCPAGFHLPSKSECEALINYLQNNGWNNYNAVTEGGISGFSALKGTWRYYLGYFHYIGGGGYWWTVTEDDKVKAWLLKILIYSENPETRNNNGPYMYRMEKEWGFSVRCLRDE